MIIVLDIKLETDPINGIKQKLKKLIQSRQFIKKTVILILVAVSVPFLYQNMTLQRFEETKPTPDYFPDQSNLEDLEKAAEVNDVSVNSRMEFIKDSKDILLSNPMNLIIGTGYGMEIAGRTSGIEMRKRTK